MGDVKDAVPGTAAVRVKQLLNVKRLARETREYVPEVAAAAPATMSPWPQKDGRSDQSATIVRSGGADRAGSPSTAGGLENQVATFLNKRGLLPNHGDSPPAAGRPAVTSVKADHGSPLPSNPAPVPPRGRPDAPPGQRSNPPSSATGTASAASDAGSETPIAEFVAEDDVREAVERGEKISIGPDTIITPLARELGEARGVFRRR